MSQKIARLRTVGLAKESTKGTAVVPSYWIPVTKYEANPVVNSQAKNGAIGRIEGNYDLEIVQKLTLPSIEGYLSDKAVGLLLLAALGQVSSAAKSAPNAAVYDHTFSVKNDNDHPALTLSFGDVSLSMATPYGMLNKLEIEAKVGDLLRYKAEFIAKAEAAASLTPAFTNENLFNPKHITVKIADTEAGLSGASAVELYGLKLSIDKAAEAVFGFGSYEPTKIFNKTLKISGEIETLENDTTWRDLFKNGTAKYMQITIANTDVTIGASANPGIVITFNKVKFNSYKDDSGIDEMIKEAVGFEMLYNMTDSEAITAILTNLATAY
jgi:hypothetical protein